MLKLKKDFILNNSTSSGIKRFYEYYGEVNMKTLIKFFGCSKDVVWALKRQMRESAKDRKEAERKVWRKIKLKEAGHGHNN